MADEHPIETSPYTDQMIGAIELRMKELGEAGNFGDAGILWQCHRVIQAMRLELGRLRALTGAEKR